MEPTIQVIVNGERRQLPAQSTVSALIEQLRLGERRLAVERNGEILPRSQHATMPLRDGDQIEIIHAIGGG